MTIKSKRAMTNMFLSAIILIIYFAYIYIFTSPKEQTLKSIAIMIFVFIAIYVVSQIITLILFHIFLSIGVAIKSRKLDEDSLNRQISTSMMDDEMDKLISLKSLKFNFISVGIGFMISLVLLIFEGSATVMLQILYTSFVVGSIIAGAVSIYFYERGL